MSLDLFYFTGGPRERVLKAIVEAGHRVKHVFVNTPHKWPKVVPSINFAESQGVPVTVVERKSDIDKILNHVSGGLCLSAGFNYIFPKIFLDRVDCCLNVHGSLLPKYAGSRTLSWAIENGETESGVTVHLVDEGMDTGNILLQREFPLSPFETTASLARKTGDFEPQVVVDALEKFEIEGVNGCVPQSGPPLPVLANRIPEHSLTDPERPLIELIDKIRAANSELYPAHFYLHGEKVCIKLWRQEKPEGEEDLI